MIYYNKSNELCLEDLNLPDFAQTVSTPFYIYSANDIKNNCNEVIKILSTETFLPCYALKANNNPFILKIIKDSGFGADVVSGGELYFALKAGFNANKIVFAGVGKTKEEITYAIESQIHSLIFYPYISFYIMWYNETK